MKTIVLSGGHVSPAIAIAAEFKKRGYHVVVFGRSYAFSEAKNKMSLEKEMFGELKIDFRSVDIPRIPKSLSSFIAYIPSFLSAVKLIVKSLVELRPIAVLSFGGYVSVPLLSAAVLMRIPIFLHEQTTTAGISNKIFDYFAQKVFISWHETVKTFPRANRNKVLLTGNPMRSEILSLAARKKPEPKKELTLYITGGSTGSHAINVMVAQSLERLLTKYTVIHQAGDSQFNDVDMLKQHKNTLPKNLEKKYTLLRYAGLSDIEKIYAAADIIIGRSGANTVTEIALLNIPSVFIPLPLSQYNEQELLAEKLQGAGIATILPQKKLSEETLFEALEEISNHYEDYVNRGKIYRQSEEITRHTNACRDIVDHIESWHNNSRNRNS